ncbi:MAG: alpha/beta fold hydrolase [Gammaproteobacteria bacterium]
MDRLAAQAGYERSIVEGSGFRHVVYTTVRRPAEAKRLHVYIGSDGTPWADGNRISSDPTPRNPLALRLMSADPAFSVYVGRPCYLGTASDDACTNHIWTSARYSPRVVASMASAISRVVADYRPAEVVLIGYSGGGTLAVLLAGDIAGLAGVITIAGNLDVAAWSATHGYLPLTESIDPAKMPMDAGPDVPFVHLVGSNDQIVPRRFTEGYAAEHECHAVIVLDGYDHACCWETRWPETLRRAEERLRSACE